MRSRDGGTKKNHEGGEKDESGEKRNIGCKVWYGGLGSTFYVCACVLSMAFTGITIVVFCPSNVDTKMLQVMWQLCTLLPAPHSLLLNLSSPFLPLPSLTTRLCCHYLPSLQPYPVHQVSTERERGRGETDHC